MRLPGSYIAGVGDSRELGLISAGVNGQLRAFTAEPRERDFIASLSDTFGNAYRSDRLRSIRSITFGLNHRNHCMDWNSKGYSVFCLALNGRLGRTPPNIGTCYVFV